VVALSVVGDARAHIDLLTPAPREHGPSREPNSNVKQGPCGQEVNGRTDQVSVHEPGETIEVTWVETTNHRSYYRVAFDVEGDDAFPTFLGNGVGTEGIDPRDACPVDDRVILAYDMADGAGGGHTLKVRLPDVECERCTLQVIQFMYDTGRPYYFQCADLVLRRSPRLEGVDAGEADAGALASPVDAAAPMTQQEPSAAPGCSSRIAPDPLPSSDDDDDDEPPPPAARPAPSSTSAGGTASMPRASGSDDGCSLLPGHRAGSGPALSLLLAGVAIVSITRCSRRGRASR
jgi:hypothetical protein